MTLSHMFKEDELLPISALQHLVYCERQCALIHMERLWEENIFTIEGAHLHDRVHRDEIEKRPGVRVVRAMSLRSLKYGLVGIADVVEFHINEAPYPVEYKRGRSKPDRSDEVQLCAQAICLEEMMNVEIQKGSMFYGQPRRREEVLFSVELRSLTLCLVERLREIINSRVLPKAEYGKKCARCSLIEKCMPQISDRHKSANKYYSNFYNTKEYEEK